MNSCPICLDDLQYKTKARPDSCDHIFCLECIQKWSKMGSYCPVDRKRFKKIQNLDSDSLIQVKPHKRKRRRAVYDFSSSCEVCSNSTNANLLLLCDSCDLGYHTHCLKPPLKEVPAGLWYCPTCISVEKKLKKKNGITKEVEAEVGGFDSISMKEKVIDKINSKGKNLDTPETAEKSSYSLQTCYDTISDFESITVMKDNSKGTSTNYLHYINSEIDRMHKTFVNKEKKRQSIENYQHLETYSVTYANRKCERMKPFDVNSRKKSASETLCINPSYTSLDKGNTSSDIDLENDLSKQYNRYIDKSFENGHNRKKSASETLSINPSYTSLDTDKASSDIDLENEPSEHYNGLPDKSFENGQRKKKGQQWKFSLETFDAPLLNSFGKRVTRKSLEELSMSEKNVEKDTEKSLKEKQKKLNRAVIASYCEDSVPSSSRVRNKSTKGAFCCSFCM